ncbi:MAG TPA: PIN domain-containing protein, partial [Candidatus Thermoplasmatota archaeon]|nr:PIN domain-containing protein [Candidatus Thermoplasmatota archaeon]
MPETIVPDTSVLVDGRLTQMLREAPDGSRVVVPMAALAELEAQANRGLETGIAGLDELATLQRLAGEGRITIEFTGERPRADEISNAHRGAIDALVRDAAVAAGALFVTSDRVQAHAAAAQGIRHQYLRPVIKEQRDLTKLQLWGYFDAQTMSVHLKADCVPMAKKGTPGAVVYQPVASAPMPHAQLRALSRECIEFAKRDYAS